MFLDQKIDEKMYFFEVAIKKSNPDWVHLPVSPKKIRKSDLWKCQPSLFSSILRETEREVIFVLGSTQILHI